jgi:hypothetical protein
VRRVKASTASTVYVTLIASSPHGRRAFRPAY